MIFCKAYVLSATQSVVVQLAVGSWESQ